MSVQIRILGCGSSGGVPRVGQGWGACDPNEPRNRRRRCSILITRTSRDGVTRVLVDTTPDLREQLLDAEVPHLDGVVYTHEHADHTHGIDDLRPLAIHNRRRVAIWCDERTSRFLRSRFDYCFETPPGSDYPPILDEHRMVAGRTTTIDGRGGAVTFEAFRVMHGTQDCLGLRIAGVAYTPDVSAIPDGSLPYLSGLDLWIVDALRVHPHPSHFSLAEALHWIGRMKPRRAVLTNLHNDLDFAAVSRSVPDGVELAYDGLVLGVNMPDEPSEFKSTTC